jgi:hypothetical protein
MGIGRPPNVPPITRALLRSIQETRDVFEFDRPPGESLPTQGQCDGRRYFFFYGDSTTDGGGRTRIVLNTFICDSQVELPAEGPVFFTAVPRSV